MQMTEERWLRHTPMLSEVSSTTAQPAQVLGEQDVPAIPAAQSPPQQKLLPHSTAACPSSSPASAAGTLSQHWERPAAGCFNQLCQSPSPQEHPVRRPARFCFNKAMFRRFKTAEHCKGPKSVVDAVSNGRKTVFSCMLPLAHALQERQRLLQKLCMRWLQQQPTSSLLAVITVHQQVMPH